MKKLLLLCVVVLIFGVILQSCKKEDIKEEIASQNLKKRIVKIPGIEIGKERVWRIYYDDFKLNSINAYSNKLDEINENIIFPDYVLTNHWKFLVFADNKTYKEYHDVQYFDEQTKFAAQTVIKSNNQNTAIISSKLNVIDIKNNLINTIKEITIPKGKKGFVINKAWIFPNLKTVALREEYGMAEQENLVFHDIKGRKLNSYEYRYINSAHFVNDTIIVEGSRMKAISEQQRKELKQSSGMDFVESFEKYSKSDNVLTCFDDKGNMLWEYTTSNLFLYKTDEHNNQIAIWERDEGTLKTLNALTGQIIWQRKFDSRYTKINYASNGEYISLYYAGPAPHYIYKINVFSGEILMRYDDVNRFIPDKLVSTRLMTMKQDAFAVVLAPFDQMLFSINLKTDEVIQMQVDLPSELGFYIDDTNMMFVGDKNEEFLSNVVYGTQATHPNMN